MKLQGETLVFARQSMTMNEATASVLYLLCGVVFPPDLMPRLMHPVALALPMTWWLEASRRILGVRGFSTLLAQPGDVALGATLLAVTAAWVVGGFLVFARLERRARSNGLLDITTAW